MLHFGQRSTPLSQIDDLIHPSLFARLKAKLFHKSEISRVKKVLFRSILIYLGLNVLTAIIFYLDLQHFAKTSVSSVPITLSTNTLGLSDMLSNAYGNPDHSLNIYNIATIISFFAIFIWLELNVVWGLLRSWVWRPLSVISKLALTLLSQLLLIVPFLVLLLIPPILISNLESQATLEVQSYHSSLREPSSDLRFISDPNIIESELKTLVPPPTFISGDFTKHSILLKANLANLETFYRGIIIPSVINKTEFAELPSAAFLVDKKHLLLSNNLSKEQLNQILSTYVLSAWNDAATSLSLNLPTSKKSIPKISFLDSDQYNEIQNTKLSARQKKFESYIAGIQSSISENDRYISKVQQAISSLESEKIEYNNRTSSLLANCSEIYEPSSCEEAKITVERNLIEYDHEITLAKGYLVDAQALTPTLNTYLSTAKHNLELFLKYPIVPEFQVGIFEPPSSITIKYSTDEDVRTPLDYYYVLLHELSHYYSYNLKIELPSFLEEGLSDYLALKIGGHYAPNTTSQDGYPAELTIIKTLSAQLGENKVVGLYFDKSPSSWKKAIDDLCGVGCYNKFIKIGENLSFAPLEDTELRNSLTTDALNTLSTP